MLLEVSINALKIIIETEKITLKIVRYVDQHDEHLEKKQFYH